jgi:hypothetical protein
MDTRVPAITSSAPERARALQPLLDDHGAEMDRRREVTPEVVDALVQADMLRLLLPRSLAARRSSCSSTPGPSRRWLGRCQRRLVHQPVERLLGDLGRRHAARRRRSRCSAARCRPGLGRASQPQQGDQGRRRLPPDRHLELRRGGRHTTWLGAHSAVQNPDGTPLCAHGRPDDRSFVFLRSEAKIIDDWQVLGLRGTGSDSYSVEDLFVPDERAPARDALEERREKGPLYTIGSTLLYATGFCSVTLGHRPAAVREPMSSSPAASTAAPRATRWRSTMPIQREIGRSKPALGRPRLPARGGARRPMTRRAAGKLDARQRIRLRLATTSA